jgi:hypothetical protein
MVDQVSIGEEGLLGACRLVEPGVLPIADNASLVSNNDEASNC